MATQLRATLVAFLLLSIITGVAYPLAMTGLGQLLFPFQANGSLLKRDGQIVGSALIGQQTDDPAYFWSRPSAVGYMQGSTPDSLIASGATNYGWTSAAMAEKVAERTAAIRSANALPDTTPIPADLLFASASGLDPHISPAAAALQVERVAQARSLSRAQVEALVAQYTEQPQLGLLGEPRVNVLRLNLALDELP